MEEKELEPERGASERDPTPKRDMDPDTPINRDNHRMPLDIDKSNALLASVGTTTLQMTVSIVVGVSGSVIHYRSARYALDVAKGPTWHKNAEPA